MKRQRYLPAGENRHIRRQKVVQRRLQPLSGNRMPGLHAHTKAVSMHPRIGAAAALDVGLLLQHLFDGLLQHLLHGHGIFLDLPAVVPGAVVAQGEKQIAHSVRPPFPENPHIQTGSSRFPATTAAITRATTAQAQRSTRPTWSWRIFVTRGLMP